MGSEMCIRDSPYAVKTLLEAKRRRDAGESLVLPRSAAQKGGAV